MWELDKRFFDKRYYDQGLLINKVLARNFLTLYILIKYFLTNRPMAKENVIKIKTFLQRITLAKREFLCKNFLSWTIFLLAIDCVVKISFIKIVAYTQWGGGRGDLFFLIILTKNTFFWGGGSSRKKTPFFKHNFKLYFNFPLEKYFRPPPSRNSRYATGLKTKLSKIVKIKL